MLGEHLNTLSGIFAFTEDSWNTRVGYGQHVYSNCPQLSCFIQSRQGVTCVPKKYFRTCLNTDGIYRHEIGRFCSLTVPPAEKNEPSQFAIQLTFSDQNELMYPRT